MTGSVVITGADGHVGRATRRALARFSNPVRPLTRADDWASEMADAEAVIHLAGTLQPMRPNTYAAANVESVRRCIDALAGSAARRVVFLSYVGATEESANEYLQTKGRAEQLIRGCGVPSVIFRSTYVYGDLTDIGPSFANYQASPGRSVRVLGNGAQRVAPIQVDDLATMLAAAALDPAAPTGTFEVGGPETLTLDEFVRLINPADVRVRHVPAPVAKALARLVPTLTPALVDVLLGDSRAGSDSIDTANRLGVTLRTFAETMTSKRS